MNHSTINYKPLRSTLTTLGNILPTALAGLFAVAFLGGCASTKITNSQPLVHEKLPKPDRILVYDFSSSAAQLPADSALAGQHTPSAEQPTAEQLALGYRLGTSIAAELVEAIHEMGLPATQVAEATPQVNDSVIRG